MQVNVIRQSLNWKGISITSQKLNRKHNSLLISIQAYPIGCHRKQEEQTKAKGPALLDPKASSASSIQDKEAWQKGTISNHEVKTMTIGLNKKSPQSLVLIVIGRH
ncbi:MAG: Uncharacterised protein [Prochlorococcus marinus str. MIT 9313]|nr:MAG: Uncharacterised protein [Prochlorococcus marinus str. MIT 9313]